MSVEQVGKTDSAMSGRRAELLDIAARQFADQGLRATTVRDIADAAGILSGSLYHHFDSKESIVDEILRGFLDALFGRYREITSTGTNSRATLEQLVRASFDSIDKWHSAVAIYQDEAKRLVSVPRFGYLAEHNHEFRQLWQTVLRAGIDDGSFREGLDVEIAYRFIRDTVWIAVRWYRPGGTRSIDTIADEYLSIVLDGISAVPVSTT